MKKILLVSIALVFSGILCSQEKLTIEGDYTWIRETPITGKVVMRLNTGDECSILEKGQAGIIRGNDDFWYKIAYNDKTGWVFGSQTSVKSEKSKYNLLFEEQLKQFIEIVRTDGSKIQNYIHPQHKAYYLQSGEGAFLEYICSSSIDTLIKTGYYFKKYLTDVSKLQHIPIKYYKGHLDKCSFHEKECYIQNEGFSFSRVSSTHSIHLEVYGNVDLESKEFKESDKYKQLLEIKGFEKRIAKEVTIGTGSHGISFYFFREGNKWYLGVIDSNDCLA